MPTHSPRSPGASSGSTRSANQVRPSRSPSSTRRPSYAASAGASHGIAPSTGRMRVPATSSTRVPGSPSVRRARRRPAAARPPGHARWPPDRGEESPRDARLSAVSTHIGAQPGEIAPVVLLPGDPKRAQWIAETFLDDATCYSEVRGMLGFTGTWQDHRVSVQGSGMGQPSMAIYVNELFREYDVAVDHPRRLVRRAVGEGGDPRRDHRLRRLHRLLDEPDHLRGLRLRAGGRLRPAARGRRGGGGRRPRGGASTSG